MKFFASCLIFLYSFLSIPYGHAAEKMLTGPQIWEKIFVPTLHEKFRKDNHSMSKVEALIEKLGGKIVLDHGGTRTADPQVYAFITRIGNALGLVIHDHYVFESKHLEAIDMQLPKSNGFKWFSTLIRYDELSPEVAKIVQEDNLNTKPRLSEKGLQLLEKLEERKVLSESEAKEFTHHIIHDYFKRNGRPIYKNKLLKVSKESAETANALLLGPDFNHLAISINHLGISHWYGLEVIEILERKLKDTGFNILPHILGEKSGLLRQTSILADNTNFPILLDGGIVSSMAYPSKYVEFIQRSPSLDAQGNIKFSGDKVELYNGFLREHTEIIYSSTDPTS
ncbi:MAG: DUF1338 family protein [Alphaproteobacteria bacterium]|nr:DUF1338 family protein [Alphaproteobacteria bacterium]